MINVGFAFNFNVQRCEVEVGDEKQILDTGYHQLLDLFIKHGLKANLFLSGFTTKLFQEMDPSLITLIQERVGKEFRLGTYTYTHPIPQLLTSEEFERQMARGLEIDREVLGAETTGFLPPEFAFTTEMGTILHQQGVKWIIALSSQIKKGLDTIQVDQDPYIPCRTDLGQGRSLIAVPAMYQLPDTPARFFKLMMKGKLEVDTVIEGIRKFHALHPDTLLLFKRDAETIFIDYLNSGFEKTYEVMDEFLTKLKALDFVNPVWIEDVLDEQREFTTITLPDYLGNTTLETFTEGDAAPIWESTRHVRDTLEKAQKAGKDQALLDQAWEHLMLSHNSDGRIGYWFSEWNPGEHTVAPSRRRFVEEHLQSALDLLEQADM